MKQRREVRLKDITTKITKGTTPTTFGQPFTESGINFIKAESVTRDGLIDPSTFAFIDEKTHALLKRSQIEADDILLTIAGIYLGKVGIARKEHVPANTNQAVAIVRIDKKQALPEYVRYFLFERSTTEYLNILCPQSAQPNLNLTQLGGLRFLIPPLPTQRKIAAVLAAYDDLIEANRRRIALLERMAEELYREWFVRLRFPGHEKTKRIKGIPVGWTVEKLREVADESSRSTKAGAHLEGRHYLPLEMLGSKQMLPLDHLPYTEAQSSLVTFEQDEFLFGAMRPYQHKVAIAPFAGVTRGTCFVIRPKQTERWAWLFLTLFQPTTVDHAMNICNGSDRPYVVWNKGMEKMPVLVPPLELTASFDSLVRPMLSAITGFYFLQRNLQRTRDLLLPRLISGKLPVEDLAIAFPPSMAVNS